MERISFDSFISAWDKKLREGFTDEAFCIYIANPFCSSKCRFCLYRSTIVNDELYDKYYNFYLPGLIDRTANLLSLRVPDSFYFGGGTSSLMTCETMEKIFASLPNFKQARVKCFEANPTSMTKDKIDILSAYSFTDMSLGVQTFDVSTLEQQKRPYISIDALAELVAYASKKGIFVNIDLLTYYESAELDNLRILTQDLAVVSEQIKPDKITIYPRYETYWKSTINNRFLQIKRLREVIKSFCNSFSYQINQEFLRVDADSVLNYGKGDYHLYNSNRIHNTPHLRYNCSAPGYICCKQNVIGLGGYRRQIPYSYMWQQKQWHMINHDWEPMIIEDTFNNPEFPDEYK